MAKQYSGFLLQFGVVEEGQFLPDIEKVVFSLTQGQVSDSVETNKGDIYLASSRIPAQVGRAQRGQGPGLQSALPQEIPERLSNGWASCTKKAYVEDQAISRSASRWATPPVQAPRSRPKALAKPSVRRAARFTIIGDECLFRKCPRPLQKNCAFIDVRLPSSRRVCDRRPSRLTGKASLAYLQTAIDLVKREAIVGAGDRPGVQEAIGKTYPSFHGHTGVFGRGLSPCGLPAVRLSRVAGPTSRRGRDRQGHRHDVCLGRCASFW